MTKTKARALVAMVLAGGLAAGLAGCVTQSGADSISLLRSDANGVVLRGLIDASRSTPPARYDAVAQGECAKSGKQAGFVSMAQKSTFGFDVTYRCTAAG